MTGPSETARDRGPGATRRTSDLSRTIRLFRHHLGNPRVYWLALLFLVLEAVTAVVEPYPIAYLVDFLQGAKPSIGGSGSPDLITGVSARYETIALLTLAIVAIAALNSASDSLTEVCTARGGRALGYRIRVAMYAHLQRLPLGYHDRRQTGDVLTRVTGDVLVVEDFVVKSASNIVGSLLVLGGSFVFLLTQSWSVALVALGVVPLLAVISNHYSRQIKRASRVQRDREGDLASTTQEMLTSIRLVQSYGRGHVDLERFSEQTGHSMQASLQAANIQARFSFVVALAEALSIAAVVWVGVWLVDRSAITIGTLVLLVLLLQNMFKPARKIVSEWYKIGKVFASVERITDLLDRDVTVTDLPDAMPAPPLGGAVTFRHVTFAYPDQPRPVLDDVSFEVRPGEVVALVGDSGAGKSTIAQLVPRLYDPDRGEVQVDGIPVRRLTLASLRRQVSIVLQDTVLLSGTVADNIGYGIPDATDHDIEQAARAANAHGFISELPEGYRTRLGERGATLSGGQRQRLAIARAFIRRAPILILDEPTTGLDAESARTVVAALRDLMRGTTTIVISHDPSLVRCADRVLEVRAGRVRPQPARGPRHAARTDRSELRLGSLDDADRRLVDGLRHRLPGLPAALDAERVAEHAEQALLSPGATVADAGVGKLWLRGDGSCSVRYTLTVDPDRPPLVLLGRLQPSHAAASAYLSRRVRPLLHDAGQVPGGGRSGSWRAATTELPGAALALHPFPLDPDLPTLPGAIGPDVPGLLAGGDRRGGGEATRVEVVHHPRSGPCVLFYRPAAGASAGGRERNLYGKVYPDRGGEVVDGFLQALAGRAVDLAGRARFPAPVGYLPDLRLLLTEALPGRPMVPRLLREALTLGDTACPALHAAVHSSAGALADLHGTDLVTAPVRTAGSELVALRREIGVVARVWPDVAAAVVAFVDALSDAAPGPPAAMDLVLSHGDFTPSQVLLDAGTPAVVDLDTLCWADPALDLGRYLAQLHLLGTKVAGGEAVTVLGSLTGTFLDSYGACSLRAAQAAEAEDRVSFYLATSLVRSALHAARQLKGYRLHLALSLLSELPGLPAATPHVQRQPREGRR
ncbi:MAG TPA: ABC transporter transmembrane domain-containing protein [Nocardioidaceae bacterium]|nr:ABC transporter transmembrane domain-containing protein [Nocardioidaceae bacterium]